MALSGSFTTNKYDTHRLYFSWTGKQSVSGNYTDVDWLLEGSGTGGGYYMAGAFKVVIDGETVYSSSDRIQLWDGTDVASGTKRIYHDSDGTRKFKASVEGGIYYYAVNCTGSSEWTLDTIPRYAEFTKHQIKSVTETEVTVELDVDTNCDAYEYSLNGGSWKTAKWGSYSVSGLSAGTSYNIRTRCRRQVSQLWTVSDTLYFDTYNYPYIESVSNSNVIIGDTVEIKVINPLKRHCTAYCKQNNKNGKLLGSIDGFTFGSSGYTLYLDADAMYESIPNSQEGDCVYYIVCDSPSNSSATVSGKYKVKGTELPTFSNFTYKDSNTTVTNVTGNNQVLVKGLSTLEVSIPSASKMVANYHANPKNYVMSIDTLTKTVNYSTGDISSSVGTITSSGTKRLNVRAYDTRNLPQLAYKDITVYDYSKPVINATISRLNNFEAQSTLKVSGTYTRLNIGGTDKNTMTSVQYRYRETGGTWSSWTTLSTTVSSGKYTCSDVILSLDNTKSFDVEIQAVDKLQTNTASTSLDVGQAIFFISSNKKKCYINGQEVLTHDVFYDIVEDALFSVVKTW